MSIILDAITNFFDRDLCASDDCIVTGGDSSGAEGGANAPLVDIAVGKLFSKYHSHCPRQHTCKLDHTNPSIIVAHRILLFQPPSLLVRF